MAIVKTKDQEWFGIKKTIFAAGEICPDKETGEFEIADEHVADVLECYGDHISLVSASSEVVKKEEVDNGDGKDKKKEGEEEVIKEKSEGDELNKEKEGEEKIGDGSKEKEGEELIIKNEKEPGEKAGSTIETAGDAKALMLASLDTKTKKELSELCEPFPGGEWRAKNKGELIEYLKEKLA